MNKVQREKLVMVRNKMGKITIDENMCKSCMLCVNACPSHLICISQRINPKGYYTAEFIDSEGKCTGCTLCAVTCPEVAIEVYRREKVGEKK
jgi:2-oxoglutarate ferredoxin oxidoreductase subunit delta